MAKIFVTRAIPEVGIELLRAQGHEVDVSTKDGVLTPEELEAHLASKPYEGIVSLLTDNITDELLGRVSTVRIVANYAVGYNNIDLAGATRKGVMVTNTPGVLSTAVAEFTIALLLAVTKRVVEADRFTRAGKFVGWAPELLLGSELEGKNLGIVGAGRIGQEVAVRAKEGLGMEVAYYDLEKNNELEERINCRYCSDLEELLKEADVVSLHVPLLDSTKHLIDNKRLQLMKPTAYLINTARGALVDETALVEALRSNVIAGAGLDVYEYEPKLADGLTACENVVLAPHIASATNEARSEMSKMVAQNINEFFAGNTPPNIVSV
ncbi:MAG: 2-hydroxyacid dehydrogenase [Candidatus Paceibacteria bacterium]